MQLTYHLWDVFTTEALSGNPLAVVFGAEALSDAQMQGLAREFNLSETSFVLPSDTADVRARYFTTTLELPMAGHPSVGTVFALDSLGRAGEGERLMLELGIGPVEMRLERSGDALARVWMDQGMPVLAGSFDKVQVAAALGLEAGDIEQDLPVQLGSAGNPFLLVPVVSVAALAKVRVMPEKLAALLEGPFRSVFAFTRHTEGDYIRARMLSATAGMGEDPATGSAHGPLGAYLAAHGLLAFQGGAASFISRQGVEMGRPSELFVQVRQSSQGPNVSVGGAAVQVGEGRLYL